MIQFIIQLYSMAFYGILGIMIRGSSLSLEAQPRVIHELRENHNPQYAIESHWIKQLSLEGNLLPFNCAAQKVSGGLRQQKRSVYLRNNPSITTAISLSYSYGHVALKYEPRDIITEDYYRRKSKENSYQNVIIIVIIPNIIVTTKAMTSTKH